MKDAVTRMVSKMKTVLGAAKFGARMRVFGWAALTCAAGAGAWLAVAQPGRWGTAAVAAMFAGGATVVVARKRMSRKGEEQAAALQALLQAVLSESDDEGEGEEQSGLQDMWQFQMHSSVRMEFGSFSIIPFGDMFIVTSAPNGLRPFESLSDAISHVQEELAILVEFLKIVSHLDEEPTVAENAPGVGTSSLDADGRLELDGEG